MDIDLSLLSRPGLALGRARPGRFEPAAALATAVSADAALMTIRWHEEDPLLSAFLSGHPVQVGGPDGWVLVCWENWSLGWGKRSGGVLKNALPKHVTRIYSERWRARRRDIGA
jgi:NOL1/NOP2/fmu family ribosome biogenesis protein